MLKPEGDSEGVKRALCRGKILERMDEIRRFYGGLSGDDYADEALAEMMLRDTCFILYVMKFVTFLDGEIYNHVTRNVGAFEIALVSFDVRKLENQIPWWLLKFIVDLIYNSDEVIRNFIVLVSDVKRVPWEEGTETEPLHLLEALRNIRTYEPINAKNAVKSTFTLIFTWWRTEKKESNFQLRPLQRPFRSVTELKAKGIYFKPTSSSLNDVRFNSHSFFGTLHIPCMFINDATMIYLSNMIALEMSPGYQQKESIVTSYVNLMKSLLEKPNDVKELQERGILVSYLQDNDEIVRMFKEIDLYGGEDSKIYHDVKTRINEHCSSKGKTWMAELVNTYFRSPWTALALFAATLLLCLTFLQTYFTIKPK